MERVICIAQAKWSPSCQINPCVCLPRNPGCFLAQKNTQKAALDAVETGKKVRVGLIDFYECRALAFVSGEEDAVSIKRPRCA